MKVKYAFFVSCFIAPLSATSIVYTVVSSIQYLVIIQKSFILVWYYIVTSSFQMSSKFINFGSWVNIYGLPLFWYSWQIVVMLFCFEKALFMCSKNDSNVPRRIYFVNRSRSFVTKFLIFTFLLLVVIVLLVAVLFMPCFWNKAKV